MTLKEGTLKRIHVNRQMIARDRKEGTRSKAITVQTSRGPKNGRTVTVEGKVTFIYRPEKPLSCGARAWAETRGKVVLK